MNYSLWYYHGLVASDIYQFRRTQWFNSQMFFWSHMMLCVWISLQIKLVIFTLFTSRSSNWAEGLQSIRHDDWMFITGWADSSRPFIIIIIIISISTPVWNWSFRALHHTTSAGHHCKNHSSLEAVLLNLQFSMELGYFKLLPWVVFHVSGLKQPPKHNI